MQATAIPDIEERGMTGKNSNGVRTALQDTESLLKQSQSTLEALQSMLHRLGTTTLASGMQMNQQGQLVNFAFVTCFANPTGSDAPVCFNFGQGHFLKFYAAIGINSSEYYERTLNDVYVIS